MPPLRSSTKSKIETIPEPTMPGHPGATWSSRAPEYDDLCRHWILRLLLDLGGHKDVLHESHCSDREMLTFIGLAVYAIVPDGKYDQEGAFRELASPRFLTLRGHAAWPTSGAGASNLAWLRERLGLSVLQARILALSALARVNSPLRRALSNLGDLDDLKLATVLSLLLGAPGQEVEEALSPSGALQRSCLMRIDPQSDDAFGVKIGLMRGVAERLFTHEGGGLAVFQKSIAPSPGSQVLMAGFEHLAPQLHYTLAYLRDSLATGRRGANVLIRGPEGVGKTSLARAIGHELGAQVFEIVRRDPEQPLSPLSRLAAYFTSQQVLQGRSRALVIFDDAEDLDDAIAVENEANIFMNARKFSVEAFKEMLKTNAVPAIWVSRRIRYLGENLLGHFAVHLHAEAAPPAVRARILQSNVEPLGACSAWCERKAQEPAIGPRLMATAAEAAAAVLRQVPDAKPEAVLDSLIGASLKSMGTDSRRNAAHDGLIDYDASLISTGADVPAIVEQLRASPSARLCFYGPPGTGKSALARHIAQAIGRPALVKRSSDLISPYVGESERAVAEVFEEARRDGAVLILDEADSFLANRQTAVRNWEVTLVNELLQQIESFDEGVFVATTNALDRLDEATMRRFDLKLEFRFLQPGQARELMRRCCERLGVYESGCEALVTSMDRLTPGDFATVVRQARFRPARSADEVARRLREEVGFKRGPKQAIGFGPVAHQAH